MQVVYPLTCWDPASTSCTTKKLNGFFLFVVLTAYKAMSYRGKEGSAWKLRKKVFIKLYQTFWWLHLCKLKLFKHRALYFSLKGGHKLLWSTEVVQVFLYSTRIWQKPKLPKRTNAFLSLSIFFIFNTFQIQQLCFVSKQKKSVLNKEIDRPESGTLIQVQAGK